MQTANRATFRAPLRVLDRRRDVSVARVTQSVVFYLHDPFPWLGGGAAKALALFLELAPARHFWVTSGAEVTWHRMTKEQVLREASSLTAPVAHGARHLLWIRIADDRGAPASGFSYREVDARRGNRTGFLEVHIPMDSGPERLLAFVLEVTRTWPVWSATGGYAVSWNPIARATAMRDARAWCRRYAGLGVEDADAMSWTALEGLPATNWLTFVGKGFADARALDLVPLRRRRWGAGVRALPMPTGLLLQAGPAPTFGDSNHFDFPAAYAEVGTALAPWLTPTPPPLWTEPFSADDSQAWFRRFGEAPGGAWWS